MQPSQPPGRDDRWKALRLYGPVTVIVVVIVVGVGLALRSSPAKKGAATAGGHVPSGNSSLGVVLRGATSYPQAKADGRTASIRWGARCDTAHGVLAVPLFPQQPCFAPWSGGDNGGSTSPGVTRDTIKVVVYLPQQNDPVLKFIYSQIGSSDTVDQQFETYQKYNDLFSHYYETYGRRVQLVRFDASGTISDSVAATADAESIAHDITPFMVIGGPLLTNAFADTLAANHVMCVSCTPGQPDAWYAQRAPYVWDIQKDPEQNQLMIAQYLDNRLDGGDAIHAGDPAMTTRKRVFGYIHVVASDQDKTLQDLFLADLRDGGSASGHPAGGGVTFADIETYQSPTDLVGSGRDIITRLKEKGVTTVVFSGDPLAPQTLTRIATEQDYFPEWVITGTVLVDTTAFSRTYDQRQWAHAFGPSNLAARLAPPSAGANYLYHWYYGAEPPAPNSAPVLLPNIQFLYGPLQAVGPDLTPANVQTVLFGSPVVKSTPVTPQISYGNHGIWPHTDFTALDDQTEVWWDPNATGADELNRQGKGMWRYVDGGRRYLPGQWPVGESKLFDPQGTVTVYPSPPSAAAIPTNYEPIH